MLACALLTFASCAVQSDESEFTIELVDSTEEHVIINIEWEQLSNIRIEAGTGLSRTVTFGIAIRSEGSARPLVHERSIHIGFDPFEEEYYFRHSEYDAVLRFSQEEELRSYLEQPISFFLDSDDSERSRSQSIRSIHVEAAIPFLSESSIFWNWIFQRNEHSAEKTIEIVGGTE